MLHRSISEVVLIHLKGKLCTITEGSQSPTDSLGLGLLQGTSWEITLCLLSETRTASSCVTITRLYPDNNISFNHPHPILRIILLKMGGDFCFWVLLTKPNQTITNL